MSAGLINSAYENPSDFLFPLVKTHLFVEINKDIKFCTFKGGPFLPSYLWYTELSLTYKIPVIFSGTTLTYQRALITGHNGR